MTRVCGALTADTPRHPLLWRCGGSWLALELVAQFPVLRVTQPLQDRARIDKDEGNHDLGHLRRAKAKDYAKSEARTNFAATEWPMLARLER